MCDSLCHEAHLFIVTSSVGEARTSVAAASHAPQPLASDNGLGVCACDNHCAMGSLNRFHVFSGFSNACGITCTATADEGDTSGTISTRLPDFFHRHLFTIILLNHQSPPPTFYTTLLLYETAFLKITFCAILPLPTLRTTSTTPSVLIFGALPYSLQTLHHIRPAAHHDTRTCSKAAQVTQKGDRPTHQPIHTPSSARHTRRPKTVSAHDSSSRAP